MSAPLPLSPDAAFPLAVLVKATLLLAAAGLASVVLARLRASAATRHLVWTLATCGLLALPLFSATLPGWRLNFVEVRAPEPAAYPLPAVVITGDYVPLAVERSVPVYAAEGAPDPVPPEFGRGARGAAAASAGGIAPGMLLLGVYLAGVLALLARLALGRWGLVRLAREARPLDDEGWRALLADLAWMLDVDRPVTLLRSARATMPMTWGTRRPVVLLPDEALEWPEERRRVVLLHELAHVARRDCLTQTLSAVACALYWFHPGAWYAARRQRVERELACDDRVLSAGTRAREYAAHLLEVARAFRPAALAGPVAVSMARPSQLEGRLLAVLDGVRSRRALTRPAALGAAAAALLLVLPLSAMRPGDAASPSARAVDAQKAESPAAPASAARPAESAGPAQQGVYERELPAREGERLVLRLETGATARVIAWDRDAVHVRAEVRGPGRERVRYFAERTANGIEVSSRHVGSHHEHVRGEHVEIRVPRRFDVAGTTEGGGLQIDGVTGTFTGSTEGGGLALTGARGTVRMTTEGGGAAISRSRLDGTLRTEGGGVVLSGNQGDLDIDSEGGAVIHSSRDGTNTIHADLGDLGDLDDMADAADAADLNDLHDLADLERRSTRASTRGYGQARGQVNISKPGGRVDVAEAPEGANISTGGGAVHVGPAGGDVNVSTGGGEIVLEAVDGSARASTGAGQVTVRLVGGGDVEISTGNGAVTLTLPADFSGDFDVETAYTRSHAPVRIVSDFPLQVTQTNDWDGRQGTPRRYVRARGRTGSGRHTVRVAAVNGDVRIRRAGSSRGTALRTSAGGDVECGAGCTITLGRDGRISGTGYTASTAGGIGYATRAGAGAGATGYVTLTGDEEGRALSVRRIGENAPPAAAAQSLLLVAFGDRSAKVQRAAVDALARLPEEHARRPLDSIAREHPRAEIREAARAALRRF